MRILSKRTIRAALAVVSSCFIPLSSWASDDATKVRTIVDTAIRPLMAQHDIPGMAVAVTVDGRAFIFNYGVASRETSTPVGDASLFELGSVSKTFTATLALYAQGRGQLSLDDHPSIYMPELKGSAIDRANLLNLGTYTAGGLPLQFPDGMADAQMTNYFRQWQPQAAPGTLRRYSSPSIGLLGHITAVAMRTGFEDAMENQIFPQLGLTGSYIRVPDSAMVNYAWGYDAANKAIRVSPGVFDAQAYGIKSTAADMIRYVQANIAPGALEEPMRRAVEGTHVGYFSAGAMVQGLGWEQYPYPVTLKRLLRGNSYTMILEPVAAKRLAVPRAPSGPILFNKTGSTGGFGAYLAFVPLKRMGIVMLANKNYPIPARVSAAHAILEQLASSAQ